MNVSEPSARRPITLSLVVLRDHWADTDAEWSHGGAWLTTFVLPPKVVTDAVLSSVGQIDLPFLVPVSAAGMYITVQCVTPPRPQ